MKSKSKVIVSIYVFLASICLFSTIFLFLYYHDNKYTDKGTQPIAGTLVLNQELLDQEKTFYLTRGWQFYPDQLLTPNDFKNNVNYFMQNITIGKHNTFTMLNANKTPYGSGTYRLVIELPNKSEIYSLVLPEIYSAYEVYLNGQLLTNMGNPNTDQLNEKIGEQTITFSATGKIELILIVTNQSHFYSGLTFPPLFGLSREVTSIYATRLLVGSIALFLAVAVMVFALYLYFRMPVKRDKRILLFFSITLCISISYLYPVIFNYWSLSPKPWYAIEIFAIYGVYFFVVLLQNEICHVNEKQRKVSTIFIGGFWRVSLLYGLLPIYTQTITQTFSWLSNAVKLFTSVYLLYTAFKAIMWDQNRAKLLLFCTTGFSIALLFDRLFPAFEPIYCGWFPEYGAVIMVLGLGSLLWQEVVEAYRLKVVFKEENYQLTKQVAIQKAHYLELTNKIKETIRYRHDERHHLQMLYTFLENKEYEQLEQYLSQHIHLTFPKERVFFCENLIVDAVLQYYSAFCKEKNIPFLCQVDVPANIPLKDTDLSILLSNLLENAYEAVIHPKCLKPFISIKIKCEQSKLMLLIENSYEKMPIQKGDKFLSSKHSGYGIGTDSIKSLVLANNGQISYRYENYIFCVSIILYLQELE